MLESTHFIHRPEGSISDVATLKQVMQTDIANLAAQKGVAFLSKGSLTTATRDLVAEACNLGYRRKAEIMEGPDGPQKDALVFNAGLEGLPNAFIHTHGTVGLVPIDVSTSTVFTTPDAQRLAYARVLNDPSVLADLTQALRAKHAPEWPKVRDQITSGHFTDETLGGFIQIVGVTQRHAALLDLYYRIAREIQVSLKDEGQLHEVHWGLADAGVLNAQLPHARDCRTSYERKGEGILGTWA
ncbi:MAG: hypothetical protein AAB383_05040 [Patescibacteria group bacterium]